MAAPLTQGTANFPPEYLPSGTDLAALPPDVVAILNAIANRQRDLVTEFTHMRRDVLILGNSQKGTGLGLAYAEVPFLDGSMPTVAVPANPGPARPALPELRTINDIRSLTGPQATAYMDGYGIGPAPQQVERRQEIIARYIGCYLPLY
ncbi:hypothetical protein MIND_00054000 [Mycena indigotica]|uniref:Mug135-like C-terminal domain-containing protein n=1 Tax=Mycena indigotica TaxID=2126181 RepID=A0A8H6WHS6_9AGAR|nr:uncharacterized protein MIND_00054000 [Mycena indigotica]KAF7315393.1 hypothetical protein MIND_00054000 [Mycena indigotica]